MRVACIPGTWDRGADAWHRPTSPYCAALAAAGHTVVDLADWNTELDGLIGRNVSWIEGGRALLLALINHRQADQALDVVVAWSHGGNVAAYALAFLSTADVRVRHLITLGTPVRSDLTPFYQRARGAVDRWTHVYGGSDWWQIFGALGDHAVRYLRGMPDAHVNRFVPGVRHAALLAPSYTLDALA
jgi:hypothetical protein